MVPRSRPLLFLDVDGPLIPIGGAGAPTHRRRAAVSGNPLLDRVDPRHGTWLAALPCDLVWATTWEAEANEVIAPLLDLPSLPFVEWPDDDLRPAAVHWKTPHLVAWAARRPFAWLDDEITEADRTWVAAHHPGPALLHRVDPRQGLTAADVAKVHTWLTTHGGDREAP
jgi:HAD domain in Swiss Army Knife RNA repair proteins